MRIATEADIPALVELVESAYRGDSSRVGWTTEADLLDGQRTDSEGVASVLKDPRSRVIAVDDHGHEEGDRSGCLAACCHVEDRGGYAYFGMFAVRPALQGAGLGRRLLAEAERLACDEWCASEMHMTVITAREDLIAWYVRRGYARTGKLSPFPYGDERFGSPKRDDLQFELLVKKLG